MPDQLAANDPTAAAMARLQDAQAQYVTAMQDAWSAIFKSYNDTMENYLQVQQEFLKGGTCTAPPKSR